LEEAELTRDRPKLALLEELERPLRASEVVGTGRQTLDRVCDQVEVDRKAWEGSGPGGISWKAIILAALGIYALLLIILNSKTVPDDFVFVSQRTRVIFLVLLSLALGALISWLVPRMQHSRKENRSTSASVSPPPDHTPASGMDISTDSG
jgi:uncharacterized integral membrane protein